MGNREKRDTQKKKGGGGRNINLIKMQGKLIIAIINQNK